jgi:DNA-binding HxlR family transcriptional regulator
MAIDVIGGKWKPLILRELKSGRVRYGELQRRIREVSPKVLTSQLRELERAGIVEREVRRESVLRAVYSLTEYGATLRPALEELARWGRRHQRFVFGSAT